MRSWDDFQPCLWQQNRTFLLRSQDNFELRLWQQKNYFFYWRSGQFLQGLWCQNQMFLTGSQEISSRVCGFQTGYFGWKTRTFPARRNGRFNENSGQFPAMFVGTRNYTFDRKPEHLQLCLWKPKSMESQDNSSQTKWRFLMRIRDEFKPFVVTKIFYWTSGLFPAVFVATKPDIFDRKFGHFQPGVWRPNQIFLMEHQDNSS